LQHSGASGSSKDCSAQSLSLNFETDVPSLALLVPSGGSQLPFEEVREALGTRLQQILAVKGRRNNDMRKAAVFDLLEPCQALFVASVGHRHAHVGASLEKQGDMPREVSSQVIYALGEHRGVVQGVDRMNDVITGRRDSSHD